MTDPVPRPFLILTRPEPASLAFAAAIDAPEGIEVIVSPLLRIVPMNPMPIVPKHDGAVFTSSNGVELAPPGKGRPAFCVGARTAEAAASRGWNAIQSGQTADDLVAALLADPPAGPLVHFRGTHARGDVANRLKAAGLRLSEAVLYDQKQAPLTGAAKAALSSGAPCIVPLFSPRTARLFAETCPSGAKPFVVAISDAAARELATLSNARVIVAERPDAASMEGSVREVLSPLSPG